MMKQNIDDTSLKGQAGGLVVIARNGTGAIVTRITSRYDLVGALETARSVLKLKADAICTEVHSDEGPFSDYHRPPLAVIKREHLLTEQMQTL
jgi:hypothetical protein